MGIAEAVSGEEGSAERCFAKGAVAANNVAPRRTARREGRVFMPDIVLALNYVRQLFSSSSNRNAPEGHQR